MLKYVFNNSLERVAKYSGVAVPGHSSRSRVSLAGQILLSESLTIQVSLVEPV